MSTQSIQINKQQIKMGNYLKDQVQQGNVTWNDPEPIEGNDYTVREIWDIQDDTAWIYYGDEQGPYSEAMIYLDELEIENDLRVIENRHKYIENAQRDMIDELSDYIYMSPKTVASLHGNKIEIGVKYTDSPREMDFASSLTVYLDDESVSAGYAGSFDPRDKEGASYWRYVHTSEIIKNWTKVLPIFKKYLNRVDELHNIPVLETE